jgi:hypothetical protein
LYGRDDNAYKIWKENLNEKLNFEHAVINRRIFNKIKINNAKKDTL